MTEAVNGLTALAFEKLGAERMEIRCDARNTRSAAVAQRAGYTLEAHLRRDSRAPDGTLRDSLIFARLREEWEGE
jgi:RimJ/RimL family protein N-acetyltransferase